MSKYDELIDMSKVDPPKLIEEKGYDAELAAIKAEYQQRFPDFEDETEFEPVRAHLGVDAWLADEMRIRINRAAKATQLASAEDTDLNVLGWARDVERKVIEEDAGIFEADEDYRRRIHMAPESWSTAGPQGGYEFWAEAVEGVKDAYADSPSPAVVDIYVIGHDTGAEVPEALLEEVTDAVSDEKRRPIADRVTVHRAEIIAFDLTATLRVGAGPSSEVILELARQSVEAYLNTRSYIGKSVPASGLYSALTVADVDSVVLTPAGGVNVTATQIAYCQSITLNVEVIGDV